MDGCGKYRDPPGFDPRTFQPVAQSLYRLSHFSTLPNIKFDENALPAYLEALKRREIPQLFATNAPSPPKKKKLTLEDTLLKL